LTPNANTTVRELALGLPQATRVFERLKIDYCAVAARSHSMRPARLRASTW